MRRSGTACLMFFFQAEDGIRDLIVTGVQTCALPIWRRSTARGWPTSSAAASWRRMHAVCALRQRGASASTPCSPRLQHSGSAGPCRLSTKLTKKVSRFSQIAGQHCRNAKKAQPAMSAIGLLGHDNTTLDRMGGPAGAKLRLLETPKGTVLLVGIAIIASVLLCFPIWHALFFSDVPRAVPVTATIVSF